MASSHVSQKLPAGLAGVLNKPDEHRDSAYYSSKDASSKREQGLVPMISNYTDSSR